MPDRTRLLERKGAAAAGRLERRAGTSSGPTLLRAPAPAPRAKLSAGVVRRPVERTGLRAARAEPVANVASGKIRLGTDVRRVPATEREPTVVGRIAAAVPTVHPSGMPRRARIGGASPQIVAAADVAPRMLATATRRRVEARHSAAVGPAHGAIVPSSASRTAAIARGRIIVRRDLAASSLGGRARRSEQALPPPTLAVKSRGAIAAPGGTIVSNPVIEFVPTARSPRQARPDARALAAIEQSITAKLQKRIDTRVADTIKHTLGIESDYTRKMAGRIQGALYDRMVLEKERLG